jgi:hypothetical protein
VIQNFKSELIVVKKILHLIYYFDIGGLEKVMTDTINHLPKFEHVVISLTYATEKSRQNFNRDVVIHELHKMPGNDLSVWKKLFSLFDSLNADVLHTYNLPTLEYQLLAYGINAVFFENYCNNGSPVTQTSYFDNLIISTKPMGCGAKQM